MGASKYSTILTLLVGLVAIGAAVDVDVVAKPEPNDSSSASGKDLLSTLQELQHSLVGQIAALESRQESAQTEEDTTHLIQHYTAQKNNIEHEIALIQTIEAAPTSAAVPRHILAHISPEEKIVPSLLNIFKKPKPSYDLPAGQFAYSAPYAPSYYPGYGPQFPYPYQGVQHHPPPKPSYMDSLIQSSFAGYETPPNSNQQTFVERNRVQSPEGSAPNQQGQPQLVAAPQVSLQGEVPPLQPQRVSAQPQAEYNPQPTGASGQGVYNPQPAGASGQGVYNPQPAGANGQGVFIYYPNAVVTEDDDQEPERPTIVDRVGQAFDRFGQVITNLATLQNLRSAANDGVAAHKPDAPATRIRVVHNRPRSSPSRKVPTLDDRMPKLRWVAV